MGKAYECRKGGAYPRLCIHEACRPEELVHESGEGISFIDVKQAAQYLANRVRDMAACDAEITNIKESIADYERRVFECRSAIRETEKRREEARKASRAALKFVTKHFPDADQG